MNEVFDVKELTRYLRCSDSTVRKLIKNKEIPNFRIANRIYFKKALIDMWIQNQCLKSVEVMNND
jgi:excisionase family DNA binding protein